MQPQHWKEHSGALNAEFETSTVDSGKVVQGQRISVG